MATLQLLTANPKGGKRKKKRSPAQRAAFAKMIAANRRSHNPKTSKRRASRKRRHYSSNPAPATLRTRRSLRSRAAGFSKSSAMGLLKTGAIGGAGAVGVDLVFGYAGSILPASAVSKINADGSANFMYYGAKGALAVALGTFGKRFMPAPLAEKLAAGSLTVMSYELMKGLLPASMTLGNSRGVGYMNPAQVMRGTGKIVPINRAVAGVQRVGKIESFNNNAANPAARNLFSGARLGRGRM